MRKSLAAVVAATGVAAIVAGPVAASAKIHIHGTLVGAEISSTQDAFKIHLSTGATGAGIQTVKANKAGTGGTATAVVYWGNGTQRLAGPFTLGKPNSQGILSLSGTGHVVGGTGAYKGVKETFKITGTFSSKTLRFNATFSGTETK